MGCLTQENLRLAVSTGHLLRNPTASMHVIVWFSGPGVEPTDIGFARDGDQLAICVSRDRGDEPRALIERFRLVEQPGDADLFVYQDRIAKAFAGYGGSMVLLIEFLSNVLFEAVGA